MSAERSGPDPFAWHPELRDRIEDPMQSMMRGFSVGLLETKMRDLGLPVGWWYSDAEREALRARTMAQRPGGDLWVFAYGSLMWNPGFRFTGVRRARVPDHSRRFILKDIYGGRGTDRAPGLMAALDKGAGCDGLAFCIAEADVAEETGVLWRREMVAPAYQAAFVQAALPDGDIEVLVFVADHSAELIDGGMTRDDQVRFCATGTGFMGTSLEYLQNIVRQFAVLGIEDAEVSGLLAEVLAYQRAAGL